MSLSTQLAEHVRAGFAGIWIQSHEHDDALQEIAQLCRQQNWLLATWDIDAGLRLSGQSTEAPPPTAQDPLAAVRALRALAAPDTAAVLVLVNFHRFLGSAEVVQALVRQISLGKQSGACAVILSPTVQLPPELDKLFVCLDHDLPGREQLADIVRGVATGDGELPASTDLERVLDAAAGLTRLEAEGAVALSLIRHGQVLLQTIWEYKAQALRKSGLLGLHRGSQSFAQLGGLENLKSFCVRAMRQQGNSDPRRRPRGVLLLSPPGCGKSQFAKALGNETGRPTITLDMGALLGGLVGQSEQNMRQALKSADAMAPCVLFCDELEKALAGAGSGQGDSGVSARLFGSLLTWLNDHQSDVFFVGTCNDISRLPPEFARAERFDATFFLDLPSREQRSAIWSIYLQEFELDANQDRPTDDGWTGAEIRACCRLAVLLGLPLTAAAQNIVPVAVTAAETIDRLRTWAQGRCLSADQPGLYQGPAPNTASRRRLSQNPSNN